MESDWQLDPIRQRPVYIREPSLTVKGLCRPLKRTFYSQFRFNKAAAAAERPKDGGKRRSRGRAGGKRFDEQVTDKFQQQLGSNLHSKSQLIARKKTHWGVSKYVAFLKSHGYEVVGTQVGVGSMSAARRPIATFVDLVATHRDDSKTTKSLKSVVLIENKCRQTEGYTETSASYQKTMQPPFEKLANTPYMQDQLQLAFTKALFEKTFPDVAVQGAMVLRVHSSGIAHYPLERSLWKLPSGAFQSLVFGSSSS